MFICCSTSYHAPGLFLVSDCVSPNRPESDHFFHLVGTKIRRTASGFVRTVATPVQCRIESCQECLAGKHSMYAEIDIVTNKHVVYDDVEAAKTQVELFYDSFNRKDVKFLQSLQVRNSSDFLDVSHVTCITHDIDLIKCLQHYKAEVTKSLANIPRHVSRSGMCIVISHPHGLPKAVSIGDIIEQDVPEYSQGNQIWTWNGNGRDNQIRTRSAESRSETAAGRTHSHKVKHGAEATPGLKDVTRIQGRQQNYDRLTSSKSPSEEIINKHRPQSITAGLMKGETCSEGGRQICRFVSRYLAATCPGSSGGPVFIQLGSSKEQLHCFIHSRHDRHRRLNVSMRKNIF